MRKMMVNVKGNTLNSLNINAIIIIKFKVYVWNASANVLEREYFY